MFSIFKIDAYLHRTLFTAKSFLNNLIHYGLLGERAPILTHYAPPNGNNVRIKRWMKIKQCLNNHSIMKIYFKIAFEFTWWNSSALTVTL